MATIGRAWAEGSWAEGSWAVGAWAPVVVSGDSGVSWGYLTIAKRHVPNTIVTVAAAGVNWSYRSLADPRQIQFISNHVGIITVWDWSFGDGTPNSAMRDPSHQFEVPAGSDSAEYDVRLTINAGPFEEKTITVFQLTVLPGPLDLDAYNLTVDEVNNMTVEQATNMTVT